MNDTSVIPVLMCGGAGTRLWPASREVHPKQFLPLFGARSTFQDTLLRVSDATLFERPVVITNSAYRFMVREQLAEIGLEADVLLEPMRRDSGPAIAAGTAFAQARDSEAIVLARLMKPQPKKERNQKQQPYNGHVVRRRTDRPKLSPIHKPSRVGS